MIITNLQLDKGCDSVVLVTDTHHDRDEMRTLIETEPYFYDTVENYLVCLSFPSFALGLVWKTYITLVNNQTQNLNQSWLESAKGYHFLPKELPP